MALWDLAGKVASLPLHRLLGTYRDKAPAYASSAVMDDARGVRPGGAQLPREGLDGLQDPPAAHPEKDIEVCEAVKKAVGDTMVLMLDSTWSYGYEDALRVGLAIQEMGFYWYEDPLAEDDIYGYVKLKQKLNIPILATEYSPGGLYGYTHWILQQATDMLRGDVALKGGITPMVKIAHLAEAFRMKCEIHHGGNSLNNVANLHITMARPQLRVLRGLAAGLGPEARPRQRHRGRRRRVRPRARPAPAWATRSTGTWSAEPDARAALTHGRFPVVTLSAPLVILSVPGCRPEQVSGCHPERSEGSHPNHRGVPVRCVAEFMLSVSEVLNMTDPSASP